MRPKVQEFQNSGSVQYYQMATKWSSKARNEVGHRFSMQKVPDNLRVRRVSKENVIGTLPHSTLLLSLQMVI